MPQLALKARPRNRLRAAPIEPTKAAAVTEPETKVLNPIVVDRPELITSLEYLSRKNPALLHLIKTLDLVEQGPNYNLAADPGAAVDLAQALSLLQVASMSRASQLPDLTTSVQHDLDSAVEVKLIGVARKAFAEAAAYSYTEAVSCIATATNVSEDRAKAGLSLMLTYQLVCLTPAQTYYRFDTTPF